MTELHNWNYLNPANLEKYYLLHWQPRYFLSQIQFINRRAIIIHQDITYEMEFFHGNILGAAMAQVIYLSFRKSPGSEHGIVLVKYDTTNPVDCGNETRSLIKNLPHPRTRKTDPN